jgi:hypothetical protein
MRQLQLDRLTAARPVRIIDHASHAATASVIGQHSKVLDFVQPGRLFHALDAGPRGKVCGAGGFRVFSRRAGRGGVGNAG